MELTNKNYLIIYVVFMALFFAGSYFIVYSFFEKKVQFRSFEDCISIVSDKTQNWVTRKGTIDYCVEQTR